MATKPSTRRDDAPSPVQVSTVLKQIDGPIPNFVLRFVFQCLDGRRRQRDIPRSSSLTTMNRTLLDAGLTISRSELKSLLDAVGETDTWTSKRATLRHGWREASFVGYRKTYGSLTASPVLLYPEMGGALHMKRGSLEAWKSGLKEACAKSDALTLAICLSFAAPLMGLLGRDKGVLFHLVGAPETGSSLCLRVCQSVFARAKEIDVSAATLQPRLAAERCASRSDLVTVFDRLSRSEALVQAVIAAVGDGLVTHPPSRAAPLRAPLGWRTMGLSASPLPIGPRLRNEEARHVDLPVPTISRGGMFNGLAEGDDPHALMDEVTTTIGSNYGVALASYLEALTKQRDELTGKARRLEEGFIEAVTRNRTAPDHSLATTLGQFCAAGIIATRLKLTPWSSSAHVESVFVRLYRELSATSFDATGAVDELLNELRRRAEAGHLPRVKKGSPVPPLEPAPLAFQRVLPGHGLCVVICPDFLRRRWPDDVMLTAVCAELKRRQLLVTGTTTTQVQVKGIERRRRYVCLLASGVVGSARRVA